MVEKIGGYTPDEIALAFTYMFEDFFELEKFLGLIPHEKGGGFLFIRNGANGNRLSLEKIGEVEGSEKKLRFCSCVKSMGLFESPEYLSGSTMSELKIPECLKEMFAIPEISAENFGGVIRTENLILSFSSTLGDWKNIKGWEKEEALLLALALELKWLNALEVKKIVEISGNRFYSALNLYLVLCRIRLSYGRIIYSTYARNSFFNLEESVLSSFNLLKENLLKKS